MRILFLLGKVVVFLLLLGFAMKNTDAVTIRYFLDMEWQAPLAFVLLLSFGIGVFAGILTNLLVAAKLRRDLLVVKRELHAQRHAHAAVTGKAA